MSEHTEYTDMTNDELLKLHEEIVEEWDKTNEVFSISDFEEIIRELTLRENI